MPARSAAGPSVFTTAKREADLFLNTRLSKNGILTIADYDEAITKILEPYSDDLTVQQKIAAYEVKKTEIENREFEQDTSIGVLQSEINDALFVQGELLRSPSEMIDRTSLSLDSALEAVDEDIAHYEERGKMTDRLRAFRSKVAETAKAMRDLVNNKANGSLPPDLDGFGYYVRTNPIDGSIVGAAILPSNSNISPLTEGMRRVSTTATVGNDSRLPVHLPAERTADGSYRARLGNDSWTGTGEGSLEPESKNATFKSGSPFDISDQSKFPITQGALAPVGFARRYVGRQDGQDVFSYYFKGANGKVYELDQGSLDSFKKDPFFAQKLSGHVPLVGADDVRSYGEVKPLTSENVDYAMSTWARKEAPVQAPAKAGAQFEESKFFSVGGDKPGAVAPQTKAEFVPPGERAWKPQDLDVGPVEGDKSGYSAPDVVEGGRKIYEAVGGEKSRAMLERADRAAASPGGGIEVDSGKKKGFFSKWF